MSLVNMSALDGLMPEAKEYFTHLGLGYAAAQ